MKPLSCRIAQMDLARQMETPERIRKFIDLLAENGYTMLLLYLEDRIITPHYQLPKPTEAYTMEQIRELVAYGQKRGIELFPCIATLGHAERFLAHPELQGLAELQEGMKGRFGGTSKDTFCVSNEAFYEFLFAYIKDVSELFPSVYFHVGLDEFWNFNLCPKCRAKAPDLHGEELLFLGHIKRVHDFLQSLGKRMVMWDDMFEQYQGILEDVPRDVIMADWQYQRDVRYGQAHFENLASTKVLNRYQDLGFEVFAAPHEMNLSNPSSMLTYVESFGCVKGLLVTSWEQSDTFPLRYYPIFATVGRMMCGTDRDEAVRDMADVLFGCTDARFVQLLNTAMSQEFFRHFQSSSEAYLFSRSYLGLPSGRHQSDRLILEELISWKDQIFQGKEILQDMIEQYEEKVLGYGLKKNVVDALDFGLTAERRQAIVGIGKQYLELYGMWAEKWNELRPGIVPNCLQNSLPMLKQRLSDCLDKLDRGCFLKLRLMHGDWYGMPRLTVSLKLNGAWNTLFENRVLKPDDLSVQMPEFFISVDASMLKAEAIRVSVSGYGGVGLAFVELMQNGKTVKVPAQILKTENEVLNPEHILMDNSCWCFMGHQNMRETYCNQELFKQQNLVEIGLA